MLESPGTSLSRFWGIFQPGEERSTGRRVFLETPELHRVGVGSGKGATTGTQWGCSCRSCPTLQGARSRRGKPWHPQELGCREEGWEDMTGHRRAAPLASPEWPQILDKVEPGRSPLSSRQLDWCRADAGLHCCSPPRGLS